MKKEYYLYLAVLVINVLVAFYNYSDNNALNDENRLLNERNKELKEIAIKLNSDLKASQEKKVLLLLTIDSLSKIDTVYIKTQSRNERTFKKDAAIIDTVNVNELIRLFTE